MKFSWSPFTFIIFLFLSVQCGAQTIVDIDGNIYQTVSIGEQVWFKENLKVQRFLTGDSIANVQSDFEWHSLTTAAYCEYANDTNNVKDYGRLYNWFAVADSRGICPPNWHTPTVNDWNTLIDFLGRTDTVAGKLNESGNAHWIWSDGTATNSSGFTVLPAGIRYGAVGIPVNLFISLGVMSGFWTSTEDLEFLGKKAFEQFILPNSGGVDFINQPMQYGLSVRCIRDKLSSISEVKRYSGMEIYPNPSHGIFNIVITDKSVKDYEVTVFDNNGKRIITLRNEPTINLTGYPKQVYFIKVTYHKVVLYRKVVLY